MILQAQGTGSFMFLIVMVALMGFIFYQNFRQQKDLKKFGESLKVGDKVVMKSGLHGKILEMSDSWIILETMAGKLKFEKSAVSLEYTRKLQQSK